MSYNSENGRDAERSCEMPMSEGISLSLSAFLSCINMNSGQEKGEAVNNNLQKWTNNTQYTYACIEWTHAKCTVVTLSLLLLV